MTRPMERVQVASIQTLWSRAHSSEAMQLPPADLLDHRRGAPLRRRTPIRKIIEAYPDAILLGLTATPCRGDGRGLGGIFETMIECPQVARADRAGLSGQDPRLCAGRSRSARRRNASRRLRREPARRPHGSRQAGRRHRHALAQVRRAPQDRRVRGQRRALASTSATNSSAPACAPSTSTARRRRTSATHPGAARIRRDRGRHQLHGADRGLGHAGGRLLHPRPTDEEDGPVSPDDRPRAAARPTARPTRSCSITPAPCSGTACRGSVEWTLDPDSQAGSPEHEAREKRERQPACSSAPNARRCASAGSHAHAADSCPRGRRNTCRSRMAT